MALFDASVHHSLKEASKKKHFCSVVQDRQPEERLSVNRVGGTDTSPPSILLAVISEWSEFGWYDWSRRKRRSSLSGDSQNKVLISSEKNKNKTCIYKGLHMVNKQDESQNA